MKTLRFLGMMVAASVAMTLHAFSAEGWLSDYDKALAQAKAEKKPVLIDFTGSDWCGWCIRLNREVFSQEEFKEYAKQNLVLLEVDFPQRKPIAPEQRQKNEELAAKYRVEGFPTLIVLNSEGKQIGTLGYQPGGPKAFIQALEKVTKK